MMTLQEQKLEICKKLQEVAHAKLVYDVYHYYWGKQHDYQQIDWETEGLQFCHEAEKLLGDQGDRYWYILVDVVNSVTGFQTLHATYKQRLEALCRVWFPKKFKK